MAYLLCEVLTVTWGRMNTRTMWHEPGRGFFTVERGEKVRRVKANCRGEREILQRYEMRGEEACVVRLAGRRRVILTTQAVWLADNKGA